MAKIGKCFERICDGGGDGSGVRNPLSAVALGLTEQLFDAIRCEEPSKPSQSTLDSFIKSCKKLVRARRRFREMSADTATDEELAALETTINETVDKLEDLADGSFTDDCEDFDEMHCKESEDEGDESEDEGEGEPEDKKRPRDESEGEDEAEPENKRR